VEVVQVLIHIKQLQANQTYLKWTYTVNRSR
jgi:hypothetical protein